MSRRLYECGICDAFHPWDWDGDCRDNANRIYDPADTDDIRSWEERQEADCA